MMFWNFNSPLTIFGCAVWNASEYFKIPLGRLAPKVFSMAIGRKGKRPANNPQPINQYVNGTDKQP